MSGSSDPAVIQAEIEATRARLGETMDQLGARLDVRAARERAYVARDIAVETCRESPPVVIGGALALVGLVAGLVVARERVYERLLTRRSARKRSRPRGSAEAGRTRAPALATDHRPAGGGPGRSLGVGVVFKQVWTVLRTPNAPSALERVPDARGRDRRGLQGAIFAATKAAIDRAGAHTWTKLTGSWPGD